ncbi:WW domain-binding protein 11-like isoform X1 [Takifugu rubripes]|uniref:WW domain-binding protein 11-like isoform X1 n=2 Tax=Takifugu rubripes TaxID=31033 RepID=UPI0011460666|nr:WW domain-binding protein 11-like isoform X1 [Takifugu rubripes]XP_029682690.1 WW domain-binding protein 11-like isoform X1 [Takifugu rubripes]XP_029682692.1 WW domain-binding protein 11-like isoform X1 [Takifugu rubripes]XP_029682693.1 WW domain-binding protein 11-like isoform X1 [Takifugu rubripes]XP_029682694.1 WW domain-binding protein 11-like isoform X1 [Takifugu rubripes]XP_029682695.1 WW domain-binding protein 11-like isoform X1 [Takifugu rubripes]XP_029682696.1 WW domain-binding pr
MNRHPPAHFPPRRCNKGSPEVLVNVCRISRYRLQKMGCSCSTSSDEWSDSDSDSSLSDFPTYVRRSTKTVELRQHTSAGTQHACLDSELKGDSRSRCDEEPLESHPHVVLPRLSTGGEENTPDVSNSFCSIRPIDADDLEQEQNQCDTDEPGPSTVLQTRLLKPPPGPEPGLLPTPPPGPEPGLLPTPPPGPEPGLLPTPPPGPEPGLLPTPPPGLSLPSEVNVRLITGSLPDIGQETRRGSPKSEFDWQDNAELQRPWLPANSRVWKIPSQDEGDGPSVPICFYHAPEDLPPPRPECQDAGTQTLPPGAGGDASTPSKIDSVCPEQRVMAEGGNSGVKTKATVWSQGTPQAEFPQRGGRVDTPGPVSELQPSKAQNCRPMLNRGLEQRSKTKADDQPAHPPGQQVGSKLTYAQVLMMPPRKRAPPPDLSPPYPEQEPQPAWIPRPIKLRYARL